MSKKSTHPNTRFPGLGLPATSTGTVMTSNPALVLNYARQHDTGIWLRIYDDTTKHELHAVYIKQDKLSTPKGETIQTNFNNLLRDRAGTTIRDHQHNTTLTLRRYSILRELVDLSGFNPECEYYLVTNCIGRVKPNSHELQLNVTVKLFHELEE